MTEIGSQHGVTAAVNRMRDLDPAGTLLQKGPDGKWPSINTLTQPIEQWKAYDKYERSQTILVTDHDQGATTTGPFVAASSSVTQPPTATSTGPTTDTPEASQTSSRSSSTTGTEPSPSSTEKTEGQNG